MKRHLKQILVGGALGAMVMISGVAVISAIASSGSNTHLVAAYAQRADAKLAVFKRVSGLPTPSINVINRFKQIHDDGSFSDARLVAPGLYAASYHGAICAVDEGRGVDACTDHLLGGLWFVGEMIRQWDSEIAPFQVNLDGLAANGIKSLTVTTADGQTRTVPIRGNAFSATLSNTTFSDIVGLLVTNTDGTTSSLDASLYFPRALPAVGR